MERSDIRGRIFNIQKFSVHDGPGIRTVVFLKGCPLSCTWCANPESQAYEQEVGWQKAKCRGCGHCRRVCRHNAVEFGTRIEINKEKCRGCGLCTEVCPTEALYRIGRECTVAEVLQEVEADEAFYSESGGGMTLSGGEPFMQPKFALALLKEARRRHIHTAVETTGFTKWEVLEEALPYLDLVIMDIKIADDEKHRRYTGVTNERILENLRKMCGQRTQQPILIRTPVVPGINDSEEEIGRIADLISPYPNVTYELLPYHSFGENKYENLGRTYELAGRKLDKDRFEELKNLVRDKSSDAKVYSMDIKQGL